MAMVYCRGCGHLIHDSALTCPHCGAVQAVQVVIVPPTSDKRILPAFILCFFLGVFGAHRFYVGKPGTAILQILTLGGFGIWSFIDLIYIIIGEFTDGQGNKITQWT